MPAAAPWRERVDSSQGADACHPFLGWCNPKGYGVVHLTLGKKFVHVLAWESVHGPVPEGFEICHSCDNPPCCNLRHLFLGTRRDNVLDAWRKGRMKAPPALRGIDHPRTHVTAEHLQVIRGLVASGRLKTGARYGRPRVGSGQTSIKAVAAQLGLSWSAVQRATQHTDVEA